MGTGRALQIMVRNPVAGRVKTRLAAEIGATGALTVYQHLLDHVLDIAAQLDACSPTVWVDNQPLHQNLRTALHKRGLAYAFQEPGDLGQRMHQAITHGLQDAHEVVLIGSDCPQYSADYLRAAFDLLQDHDVVLGPATDGGYVLIGARRECPDVFAGMPWSHPGLLAATRNRLRQLDLGYAEMQALHDIDCAEDLERFPAYRATVYPA